MLISICSPCMNRVHDLKKTLPYRLEAANESPPVEIVVLDYNSRDDLRDVMAHFIASAELAPGNRITYKRYTGRETYHQAHAYNLSILAGSGEYFCLLGADAYPEPGYIQVVRNLIGEGCAWGHAKDLCGFIFCQRQEFIDAGGYDERFEFYGPEDRDLNDRLTRRGGKFGLVPKGLMHVIPTPERDKVANYRVKGNKSQLSRQMAVFYHENAANNVLVANQGQEWGSWK